nr:reverse transcriptase domain-containing protein [Tanacetum cinerariifolium]
MAKEDEEKTAFITSQGIFCYSNMPFGLKNVRANYQRLVDKALQKQIGRNLEVYVDDLVIKSHTEQEIIRDIEKTFKTLRKINMKLNPNKCTFGIEEGMFLGYKVKALVNRLKKFSIKQVPRSENEKADALSKIASANFAHLTKQVLVEVLNEKSINKAEVLTVVEEEGNTWMTSIYEYLTEKTLPAERKKARAAKPIATRTNNQIKKFVWDNIVCRFGLPGEIISNNEKRFKDNPFKDWCEKLNISQHFASVKHPQTNGLVERANRSLEEGIKARLEKRSEDWMEEVSHVLWAHHTMIKSGNGDTSFSLTYRTEAVIPAEIGMPTDEVSFYTLFWGDVNPIRTLRDYSRPSHERYHNAIELPKGVKTHFEKLLQKVPHHGLDLWLQVQIFYDHVDYTTQIATDYAAGERLRKLRSEEAWETI